MVLGRYTHVLPDPQSINYDCTFQCNKSFTPSLSIWFWLKHCFLSFPWNYGVVHGHHLRTPSRTSKWRTTFGVTSGFNLNVTSSWWRTWNSKGACLSWRWTPSSLILSYFFELSHLGDLVASWPYFWWRTWNRLWRLLWNWKYSYLCMVFSSRHWTLSLVVWFDSSTPS
jgi:hypothetical protein